MDKRTLLFVLVMGATFFGVNLYFSHSRDQKEREYLLQQDAQNATTNAKLREEAVQKTASLESLPVARLYADENQKEFLAYGIRVREGILTLAWKTSLPKTLYVDGSQQTLLTDDIVENGPVLYGASSFKQLHIATVPDGGQYELQLVTLPSSGTPQVLFANYQDGHLYIPLGAPSENAIGLYKVGNEYLPLGFYESRGGVFVEIQKLPNLSALAEPIASFTSANVSKEQKFYILENTYMQLVFSNVGGALAEINLPFTSASHPQSVVKEIGFDRDILEISPPNARFPLHSAMRAGSSDAKEGSLGGYYPLLRRGIVNGKETLLAPQYYALNIVSDYPEMAELVYEVKEFTQEKIVFEASQPHRKITKTYHLDPQGAPYVFDLTVKVEGDSRGLWITSGIPEVEIMSNSSSPQIQYRLTRKGKGSVEKLDLPKAKEVVTVSTNSPDWVLDSNGYLGMILDPLSEISPGYRATGIPGQVVPTRLTLIDSQYNLYPASKYPGYEVMLPLPNKGGVLNFRLYAGPFEEDTLKAVDKIYTDPQTGYNPNYLAGKTFYGWFSFISEPFAKFLFIVMRFFYSITHSWGFSIILLTVFLRILLYPLNAWSIKAMRRMQQISPQVQAIQQRHKKDPKKAQMEIMALYREKKVNPLSGCLPILIQIPFLIGMFDLLKSSFQLRGASFIPGWIDNLTAPDVLFSWNRPIFFIGNQFHLLPIILGVVMFFQQRLSSPTPKDPSLMTDQQRQQRTMGTMMTIVFAVLFYHFPSGLNIYWLSSMLLGMGQQWLTNRYLNRKKGKVEVEILHKEKPHKKRRY